MAKQRKPTRRENVSLPVGLLRHVDKAITQSDLFTSRGRFIEEATKHYLFKMFKLNIVMYGIKNQDKNQKKLL